MQVNQQIDDKVIEDIASFTHDPVGYVDYAYDWGHGDLEGKSGVRKWQGQVLQDIKDHLNNPLTVHQPLLLAVASGHSIGKSALIAMICGWGLDTFEDTRIIITANTETQLRTKTQPEVSKWFRRSITKDWWDVTATKISTKDKKHESGWRADFVPWSEHNTEAFAGLHNEGKRIIIFFDEGSSIPDRVWEVTEGVLIDEGTEIIWIAFGNPTRISGRFRECFRQFRHRWVHRQIDSRTVEGTNKKLFKKWEDDYGEDSDFFKVRVRGQFPSSGDKQFIPTELADEARARGREPFEYNLRMPLSIGIDFARSGEDSSVIRARRGRHLYPAIKFRERDSMKAAGIVVDKLSQSVRLWGSEPDGIFADGGSVGGPIIDRIKQLGVENITEVMFGSSAQNKDMWGNKRIEMWASVRDWLSIGCLDDNQQLYDDLIAPEMLVMKRRDQFVLESKEDMNTRGLPSTDDGDSLALTFAFPVVKKAPKILIPSIQVVDYGVGY